MSDRIVILVDMDCFYVQVEQNLAPEFLGKPCAVVQYNAWKGGGIIAVNYEARDCGVTRNMRGDMAKTKCPEIHLFKVPEERGKANLSKYREAGAEVMKELCKFSDTVERASIDEAYLDVTNIITARMEKECNITPEMLSNTFVVGFESSETNGADDPKAAGIKEWLDTSCTFNHLDKRLAMAGILAEEMRTSVYENTGYRCSAGIAHNKMLAKLTCGLHKPNKQTLLPFSSIPLLYETIPIHKVRSLGGKFGEEVKEKLGIEMMSELSKVTENELQKAFGEKNGSYLYDLARGVETDPVTSRQLSKSIGCGKNFPGKTALSSRSDVSKWLTLLVQELSERLKQDHTNNERMAQLLTISVRKLGDKNFSSTSRSCPLYSYETEKLVKEATKVLEKLNTAPEKSNAWTPPLTNVSLSAGKFQDSVMPAAINIQSYFTKGLNLEKPSKKESCLFEVIDNDSNGSCSMEGNMSRDDRMDPVIQPKVDAISESSMSPGKGFFAMRSKQSINCENNCNEQSCESTTDETIVKKQTFLNITDGVKEENDNSPMKGFFAAKEIQINHEDRKLAASSSSSHIGQYFMKAQDTFHDGSSNYYQCDECDKKIALNEVEDHLDYHFALKLQKELRGECSKVTVIKSLPATSHKNSDQPGKRKLNSKPKKEVKKAKKENRTLDFYLNQ